MCRGLGSCNHALEGIPPILDVLLFSMIRRSSLSTKYSSGLESAEPLGWKMAAKLSQVSADCRACKTTAEMVEVKALTATETIRKAAAAELVWDIWLVSTPVSAGRTPHVFDDVTFFGLVAQDMEENFAAERLFGGVN